MREFRQEFKLFFKQGDIFLLILCCLASLYGLVLIASATNSYGTHSYVIIQLGSLIFGIVIYIIISMADIELFTSRANWITLLSILFILSLLIFGEAGDTGNRSWIRFPFIGIGVQPAEVVKVFFIIVLARQITDYQQNNLNSVKHVALLVLHLAVMVGLILFTSSDLGVALIYVFIFVVMLYTGGIKLRWVLIAVALVLLLGPLIWNYLLRDDQKDRIMIVFDPSLDPDNTGVGWQASRSRIALGAGQIFGAGLFKGAQVQYSDLLPAKHTDFIFAVAGEELGLVGCLGIIVLLTAVIFRCIYVGYKSRNALYTLVCFGIAGMLIFQTYENIGMCLGVTPIVGITLPFFSYGGTSIVTLFFAMGLISSVKMHPAPDWHRKNY